MTAACATLMIYGCRKETCEAGAGGGYTFEIYPEHHGEAIPGSTCYLEFNTRSSPGSLADFDLKVETDAGSDFITIKNMGCGDYFIYCVGTDMEDSLTSETVTGGIPYSIPPGDGKAKIKVPVTE